MIIRLTLVSLTAALALLVAGSTALAVDGNGVGRWAQPAASQPDVDQTVGRWRPGGFRWRPQGSVQPQPRFWRPQGSVQRRTVHAAGFRWRQATH